MNNIVIRTEGLGKTYRIKLKDDFTALRSLSLEIERGEVFGFLGPNGAGKTTTIKILVNLIFPTSGAAWILDKHCNDPESRRHIGYLPEISSLFDFLTFEEVLDFAGRSLGMNKPAIKAKTDELSRILDMERAKKIRLRKFSKGMQQRAGLAYALMGDPAVLILDEPMSGLDPIGRKDFVDLIRKLKREGKTIFFSSHVLSDIENVCDRVGILVNGELKKIGKVSDLLHGSSNEFSMRVSGLDGEGSEHLKKLGVHALSDGLDMSMIIPKDKLTDVMDIVKARSASIVSINTRRNSLEDIFMNVVRGNDLS
jgi:ABC-2 type transport system ATP-binding protein